MIGVVLIGYGAIARMVLGELAPHGDRVRIAGVLVRRNRVAGTRAALEPGIPVITGARELGRLTADLVVECAGQGAVEDYGEAVLGAGLDFMVIGTGALADDEFRGRLVAVAERGSARLLLPAGAIAGIDGLCALRLGGLHAVRYTATKPPYAWKDTPADEEFDLDGMTTATVIFEGPANLAARRYPRNANLAATVALAGLGMDRTEIRLVADPAIAPDNMGRIEARGTLGTLDVQCRGRPAADNPKTSAVTAYSIVHQILNRSAAMVI